MTAFLDEHLMGRREEVSQPRHHARKPRIIREHLLRQVENVVHCRFKLSSCEAHSCGVQPQPVYPPRPAEQACNLARTVGGDGGHAAVGLSRRAGGAF